MTGRRASPKAATLPSVGKANRMDRLRASTLLCRRQRRALRLEPLESRRVLAGGEINLGGQTDVFDQPYVQVELRSGDDVIGPTGIGFDIYPYNRLLLDTGANGIIAVSDAVTDMEANGYQTEGTYEEIGVSGVSEFDVSAAYELRFWGSDEVVHTLPNTVDEVRIMSNPDMMFGIEPAFGGIPGIVGMPAMVGRVTTLDMTQWNEATDLFDLAPLGVTFSNALPAGNGHRYSVATDTRMVFDVRDGLPEDAPPDAPLPTWAPITFLDVSPYHQGTSVTGGFLLDTGAQLSMLSSQLAFDLGLDENGNGDFLDEAIDTIPIIGVGGTVEIPLLIIDELSIPTEQGTLITFAGGPDDYVIIAVHDVAPGIEGILGADLLTSGLGIDYETLEINGRPYFNQIQMDFRQLGTQGVGRLYFDVNPIYDIEVPLSQPPSLTLGGNVTYTENQPPVILAAAATLTDSDSPNFDNGQLTVDVVANATASDRLAIIQGNGITTNNASVSYNGAVIGTASGGIGDAALVVDLNANATPEAVQALIRRIGFRVISNAPSTAQRRIEFRVSDGGGGQSAPAHVTVNVVAMNDAPVLNAAASPTLAAIPEDATNPQGTLVRSLLAGAYADPDGVVPRGIAVTAASGESYGDWEYSLNNGVTWTELGAVSGAGARLLPADARTRVRFVPDADWNGQVRLYYRGWDQSQGGAGATLNVNAPGSIGGTGWFSVAADSAPLRVLPRNDPPVLTGSATVGYRLNDPSVALATSFALSDSDSAHFGGGQLRVRITSGIDASNRLIIRGGFTLSGNNVLWNGRLIGTLNAGGGIGNTTLVVSLTDNATVELVERLVRSIRFRTVNGSLTDTRTVNFSVSDGDGGVSNSATSRVAILS